MKRIVVSATDKATIIYRYTQLNETFKEIATDFPFSVRIVRQVLVEEGIPIRKSTIRPETRKKVSAVWEQADKIVHLYLENKFSLRAIANQFHVSQTVIIDILDAHNIPRRSIKEARRYRRDKYGDTEFVTQTLIELREDGLLLQEIAEVVNLSVCDIYKILKSKNAFRLSKLKRK